MLTIAINPESFELGFIVGTSVYVVLSGAAYIAFCGIKRLVELTRGMAAG